MPHLAAAGVLPGHQPEPGGEMAARTERPRVGHGGGKRRGDHRADARHLSQRAAHRVGAGQRDQLRSSAASLLLQLPQVCCQGLQHSLASGGIRPFSTSPTMASSCRTAAWRCAATMPSSVRCPRSALIGGVRWPISWSRTRCSIRRPTTQRGRLAEQPPAPWRAPAASAAPPCCADRHGGPGTVLGDVQPDCGNLHLGRLPRL
jgi:hypothetical protein